MWIRLVILGFEVSAKVFEKASVSGIPGLERVSKLTVSLGSKQVLDFDRGWNFNVLPEEMTKMIMAALAKAIGALTFAVHNFL